MTIDKDVFFKHEVCRGPVVHVDMMLGMLGHPLYKDYIITTLKHNLVIFVTLVFQHVYLC